MTIAGSTHPVFQFQSWYFFKVAGVAPIQTIEIDRLGEMVGRFNVPVNLPEILAQQDYAHVLRILEAVILLQDEEDIELLLLG